MDETEREELKEAYRKEKDPRVAARMLAVHTVYVRKTGIDDTAAHLMRSARWVRNWLHRYDEGGLDGLRDLPRSGRPRRIPRETIEQIVNKTVQPKGTPAGLQKRIHEETGTKLHITYIRKIMRMYDLSPKESQRVHINSCQRNRIHKTLLQVTQGVAEGSHQQGRQKGRPELAISLQKASSTPRKGRIYPGHGR